MEQEFLKIREFLQENMGKNFNELGISDESKGRWVKEKGITNNLLVRHIKVNVATNISTSQIGKYLHNDCSDLLEKSNYWTNQRGRRLFWYSWNKDGEKKEEKFISPLEEILDCPYLISFFYVKKVGKQMKELSTEWDKPVVVRFGKTGTGRIPNYQIESECGEHVQTFHGDGNGYNHRKKNYDDKKLTRPFTMAEYQKFLNQCLNG